MALDLKHELLQLARLFEEAGIDYAVCGGVAVAIHGHPRATRDIDLLVRQEDLEKIKQLVAREGFTIEAGTIPFDTGKETERRVFRISKAEGEDLLTLDLMLVAGFLEEAWSTRERYRLGDQEVQVVSREGLKKMKAVAGRAQDRADLEELGLGQEE